MGFNFSGIVINKSYKDNVKGLQEDLGLNLEPAGEINYQQASANWKDEGICDIYFSEHGTLLFLHYSMCLEARSIENCKVLTFAVSEVSMAFTFNYCEGDKLVRSFMEAESERVSDEGEQLPAEEGHDALDATIAQLGTVLGQTFWSIDFEAKAFRYKIA